MRLKIHIIFILGLVLCLSSNSLAVDKFIRIKGNLIDEVSKEEISDYTIKLVDDQGDSSFTKIEKTDFDFWLRDNRSFKMYFIKKGYHIKFAEINANFMPSYAYEAKHKLNFEVKMTPTEGKSQKTIPRPVILVQYVKNQNGFEVKDMTARKEYLVPADYEPPFPCPADVYVQVKPTTKRLTLTTDYNEPKAFGESGMPKVIQGILFADMNYCFFNERTNDANKILEKMKLYDPNTWATINPIDSPEYGIILSRTVNREQSVDTLFALGQYLETSRFVFQNFTADSKVLTHLKQLRLTLEQFEASGLSFEEDAFINSMKSILPNLKEIEDTYKEQLKNKMNFEIAEDPNFIIIKKKIEEVHKMVTA